MAGAFTSVDLSQLPAPDVVKVIDYETILGAMLADLRARAPEYDALVESDTGYKVLEVAAYRESILRQQMNDAVRAVMLAYAMGSDLDQLGANLGVPRLELGPGDPANGIPPTMETDTDFRRRIQLAPEGFSVAGPEGAYVFHALGADPRVLDASATSPSDGVVVVSVLSRDGDGAASADLVAAVDGKLSADDVRPLTDKVQVQSATIVDYQVTATVWTFAGPDAQLVLAASNKLVQAYIDGCHRLGRDVTRSGIIAALHSPGVQRVELLAPSEDLVIDRLSASNCTAVNITYGGVDE